MNGKEGHLHRSAEWTGGGGGLNSGLPELPGLPGLCMALPLFVWARPNIYLFV